MEIGGRGWGEAGKTHSLVFYRPGLVCFLAAGQKENFHGLLG